MEARYIKLINSDLVKYGSCGTECKPFRNGEVKGKSAEFIFSFMDIVSCGYLKQHNKFFSFIDGYYLGKHVQLSLEFKNRYYDGLTNINNSKILKSIDKFKMNNKYCHKDLNVSILNKYIMDNYPKSRLYDINTNHLKVFINLIQNVNETHRGVFIHTIDSTNLNLYDPNNYHLVILGATPVYVETFFKALDNWYSSNTFELSKLVDFLEDFNNKHKLTKELLIKEFTFLQGVLFKGFLQFYESIKSVKNSGGNKVNVFNFNLNCYEVISKQQLFMKIQKYIQEMSHGINEYHCYVISYVLSLVNNNEFKVLKITNDSLEYGKFFYNYTKRTQTETELSKILKLFDSY